MFLSRVVLKNWYTSTTTKIIDDSAVSVTYLTQNDSVWAKNYSVVPQDGWRRCWWETTKLGQTKTGTGMWTFQFDVKPWSVKTDAKYERIPKVNKSTGAIIKKFVSANLTKIENYKL